MSSSIWIIIGIGIYAIFIIAHGFGSFKSTSKDSESFFMAGRGVNPFVLLCTTAISVFSALAFYGVPASIYRDGIGFFSNTGGMIAGLMFASIGYRLWLLGKEYGFTTPVDFLRTRYYSESYGVLIAIVLILFIVPYVAMQLVAIGDATEITTKGMVPYIVAVALGTLVVSLHIIGGGMKSVAWMDTFHFILGTGTLIVLCVYLVTTYFPNGGLAEAVQKINSNPELSPILSHPGPREIYNWKGTLNNALAGAVATVVWPHIFMRTFIASSKDNFKMMAWAMPLAYVVVYGFIVVLGALIIPAILSSQDITQYGMDNVVSVISTQYASPFISFISLLCLFAFGVSTADSMLLSASAIGSRDLYVRHKYELRNLAIEPRKVVTFGRILLLVLMVLVLIVVALKPAVITDYAYKLSSPFFAQILPATLGGLYWKKGTKEGAWAGTVAGLLVTILFTFFIKAPFGFSPIIWALLINSILYYVVSIVTKVPSEIVSRYVTRIDSIIYSGSEVKSSIDNTLTRLNSK
ncbi:sodium:solute symporter family protein [Lonepinella koalarum]|uniref:SSS family solute:Na+ symporter n=1 Tax=Lonepinella koalarum TaxID=53417 RepID=A0A4R1KZA1_9PAST|nr:sodium:solute symporter family protein [Lonepinella koalarum]MDH2927735.1 sodium:pantothenate symporter [Lonepinella koalarum]TCK69930.1 SSS family solute:Na+ symporter [Lonepinella koalarum]TFJ90466.1 sodium:solute symporter family protein [Lonepinella koalarum]TYG35162.1 sodium:solute symporter family protein [Lonepinella koalarum]